MQIQILELRIMEIGLICKSHLFLTGTIFLVTGITGSAVNSVLDTDQELVSQIWNNIYRYLHEYSRIHIRPKLCTGMLEFRQKDTKIVKLLKQ